MKPITEATGAEIILAALHRARLLAAKSVRFTTAGLEIIDALGEARILEQNGVPVGPFDAEFREGAVEQASRRYWRPGFDEVGFPGFGEWNVAFTEPGLVLSPKKPFVPWMEPLFDDAEGAAASIRSLYATGGVDVFLMIEGEARAKAVASALASERALAGLPVELSLLPGRNEQWRYGYGQTKPESVPDLFDFPAKAGPLWRVTEMDSKAQVGRALKPEEFNGSDVIVASCSRLEAGRIYSAMKNGQMKDRERPMVAVAVVLEKSRPVARMLYDERLDATVSAGEPDGPWRALAAHRASRTVGRKAVPKTWHSTTEAVAEAFVAREAPRGYVSNKSLFFHGPVAYSQFRWNPVAAIVDFPGGKSAIFYGQSSSLHGTKAGTSSSAQADVRTAAGKRFEAFYVDEMEDFLLIGKSKLEDFAADAWRKKNEKEHPTSCRIDVRALKRWLGAELEKRNAEVERAFKTSFPTYAKANALSAVVALSDMQDRLSGLMGIELPQIAEVEEYRQAAKTQRAEADERQRELAGRRKEAASAGVSPRPGM